MVASQVMRRSMMVSDSEAAVWAARSRAWGLGGWPRPPAWRWYSSWISWKTATSGRGLELVGDSGDLGEAAGLAEGAEEALGLDVGLVEGAPLGDDDGPGEDAGDEQDSEDGKRGGAAVVDHVHDGVGMWAGEWTRGCCRVLQKESEGEESHMLVFSVNASDGLAVLARNGLRYGRVVVVGDSLRG